VGEYQVDVKGFRTNRKDWLKEQVLSMTRKRFSLAPHLLQNHEWDYFHMVEIGLDRLQHGFWKYHDPEHRQYQPGNSYADVIRDYYLNLDNEIGLLLELLDDETLVLVVSDHGAQRLDGGFCVNEWLIKEGLLVLDEYPAKVTPFDQLGVNWDKTRVWSEGGYYARVFLNVKGREPRGTIDPADYEDFRNDVKARLEATVDDKGRNLGTLVYRPEDIYSRLNRVAPDLIVHFGGLGWRSIGGVGYPALHIQENDTGPDDCNHSQYGAFVLAGPDCMLRGELESAHILDVAPTLLELSGYDVPACMQGQSWLKRQTRAVVADAGYTANEEELVRERLSGLGYIS
jgi:predicted AlkP superfamily phosphohydrolase/phosphomutase